MLRASAQGDMVGVILSEAKDLVRPFGLAASG